MKAHIPHSYLQFASKFSTESMIKMVAFYALDIFKNPDPNLNRFAGWRKYTVVNNGKPVQYRVQLVQTWLTDLIYDLTQHPLSEGKTISKNETLHLIRLYNDYTNKHGPKVDKSDLFLLLYGMFGEQKRWQDIASLFNEFAREKYILDILSQQAYDKNISPINVRDEFKNFTGFSTSEYSALLFLLYSCFTEYPSFTQKIDIEKAFTNPIFTNENVKAIIDKYSITIDKIRSHPLKRQVLYTKPIIKTGDEYISANPFLILCLFINSNHWVIRDLYNKRKSQQFTIEFGRYFEMYVAEILENCLCKSEFERIQENDRLQADWHLKLAGYDFLIEQKSSISLLGIKQSQPNLDMMKKHIITKWGKATEQLISTQKEKGLINPIKIILVYEDYYKSECLDELFRLRPDLNNDKKFWLVTIKEFEMLMMTYKESPELFAKIVEEKDRDEMEHSMRGRELWQVLTRLGITKNKYLEAVGITQLTDEIHNSCK